MKKLESSFWKNKVKPFLEVLPKTYARKTQELAKHGVPDVEILIRGNFIVLELKKDLRTEQNAWKDEPLQASKIRKVKDAGGYGRFVSPASWPEVSAALYELALTGEVDSILSQEREK
jgi:hypothetical protein